MPDKCSKETRSYNMSQIRSKNTKPEEMVRKYLFSQGLRYRKNDSRFPGKPDIVLPKYKTIIFVNGCFWHRHEGCKYFVWPKSNAEFWKNKILSNVVRDEKNYGLLTDQKWNVIVVWECELKPDLFQHTMGDLLTSSKERKMNQNSRTLSIIAYYLSEYDLDAVHALGYSSRSEAFKQISVLMGRDNNYLKLRRDEFDALPDSSSSRNGWKNRLPANEVVNLAFWLKDFNFTELSEMVNSLIKNAVNEQSTTSGFAAEVPAKISENELENLLNMQDSTATINIREGTIRTRVYDTSIISQLKKLYRGKCQLCGSPPFTSIKTDITEAHHIDYFSKSQNNNASNLIILCPNHHRLIHKLNPIFDNSTLAFLFDNGHSEKIKLNYHIDNNVAEEL